MTDTLKTFMDIMKKAEDFPEAAVLDMPILELRALADGIKTLQDEHYKLLSKIEPLVINYRNWRGEVSCRNILPLSIWYGVTEWHKMPQWFLKGFDLDKQEQRDFAISDFRGDNLPA